MMKKLLYVLVSTLLLLPSNAFAAGTYSCLTGSGWTPSAYNGTYSWIDNSGGNFAGVMHERYGNGSRFIYTESSSNSLLLSSTLGGPGAIADFYNNGVAGTGAGLVVSDILYTAGYNALIGGEVTGSFVVCAVAAAPIPPLVFSIWW